MGTAGPSPGGGYFGGGGHAGAYSPSSPNSLPQSDNGGGGDGGKGSGDGGTHAVTPLEVVEVDGSWTI